MTDPHALAVAVETAAGWLCAACVAVVLAYFLFCRGPRRTRRPSADARWVTDVWGQHGFWYERPRRRTRKPPRRFRHDTSELDEFK